MAIRYCPLCGARIESWQGRPLRVSAAQHRIIVHDALSPEQSDKWAEFMQSLPPLRVAL